MRLANNRAVVQAYYVVYHATQALAVGKGFPRPDSHPKTQNQYVSFWIKRPLDLSPWTLGADDTGWANCPPTRSIDSSIHGWSGCSPATQLSLAAKAFRTTRDDAVDDAVNRLRDRLRTDRRKKWEAEESARLAAGKKARAEPKWRRPQLSAAERSTASGKVPPHGLIHYLYRLRIKTNYVDSAMFTDGPTDESSSALVQWDLRYIAGSTLLVHELHIAQLVGVVQGEEVGRRLAGRERPGSRDASVRTPIAEAPSLARGLCHERLVAVQYEARRPPSRSLSRRGAAGSGATVPWSPGCAT